MREFRIPQWVRSERVVGRADPTQTVTWVWRSNRRSPFTSRLEISIFSAGVMPDHSDISVHVRIALTRWGHRLNLHGDGYSHRRWYHPQTWLWAVAAIQFGFLEERDDRAMRDDSADDAADAPETEYEYDQHLNRSSW